MLEKRGTDGRASNMSDEYWSAFSIFDHRGPLYRKALVLFDRVVMPVPTAVVRNSKQELVIDQQEIDALSTDADYLVKEGAAIRFDWDINEFYKWRENTSSQDSLNSEALAKVLVNDPPYATRLQLSQKYSELAKSKLPEGVDSVVAVPVYSSKEKYDSATSDLLTAEQSTLEIVTKKLAVPAENTPLESIIRLRDKPQFRDSMYQLRRWQTQIVDQLLQRQGDPTKILRTAEEDLKR